MKVAYKPEKVESGMWIIRRYVDGELDIIVEHKPFENQFSAHQFARLLMRNVKTSR